MDAPYPADGTDGGGREPLVSVPVLKLMEEKVFTWTEL